MRTLASMLVFVSLTQFAAAQSIRGVVIDSASHGAIPGVRVELRSNTMLVGATLTDEKGAFFLNEHESATSLVFKHIAYAEVTVPKPAAGFETTLRIALPTIALRLEALVATGASNARLAATGFFERKRHRAGVFIDGDEIERRGPMELSDMLRVRPGVRVVARHRGGEPIMRSAMFGCLPAVFVDSHQVRKSGSATPAFDEIVSPARVAGMEAYQGNWVPAEFAGESNCGVILIWTRR